MNVGGDVLSPSQCEVLEKLCSSALELPATQRREHILAKCDDVRVRSEALSLLEQVGSVERERFLNGVASLPPVSPEEVVDTSVEDQAWMPDRIAGYRIIRKIGAGGMGDVWEAEQESPKRRVAVKTIRQHFATPGLLKRFRLEAQILGQLQHPAIAQIHEFGTATLNGMSLPFFAMELVEGRDLSTYLAKENLSRPARLQLFLKICDAISFAHLRGVMHRDIKPNNILIDDAGQPKILDFGLARMTDSDVTAGTLMTETGQIQGTLHYMSPEQARGDSTQIDLRSDVYALGVILYELLTGQLPLSVGRSPLHEAVRVICEESPKRLSTIVRVLRGDLETITLKALEKDPQQRYQNVDALADDIRRHLTDQPILGRPPSAAYQFKKLIARNKALFGFIASLFVVTLGFGVWMSVLYAQADNLRLAAEKETNRARLAEHAQSEARQQAEDARDNLETVVAFQQSMLSSVEPEQMGKNVIGDLTDQIRNALTDQNSNGVENEKTLTAFEALTASVNSTDLALKILDENLLALAVETIEKDFADQPVVAAALRQSIGDTYRALGLYDAARDQFQLAIEMRRAELGDNDPATFQTLSSIGSVLRNLGNYSEAETYEREALEGRRRVLGNDHPDTLSSIDDLGLLLHYMGRYDDAEVYYREALKGRHKVIGADHPDTLDSRSNLVQLLVSLEKLDEAYPLALETLDAIRAVHGDDSKHTILAMHNLSYLLKMMGKYEDAEKYARAALAGFRRVMGDDHPNTISSMTHLGLLLREVNKFDEAKKYIAETLERNRRILGDDHPSTQNSVSDMGLILETMGDLEGAEPYYRESLEGTRRSLGNDHPNTLAGISNLAYLLQSLGKLNESESLYREVLEGCRRVLGHEHPQTLQAVFDMSVILRQTHRLQEAEALAAEAVRGARATFPRAVPHFLAGHGKTLLEAGDYAAAQSALLEAQSIFELTFSATHHRTVGVRQSLVQLYTKWTADEPNRGHDVELAKWQDALSQ